ncbi:hypothetical protein GCM10008097_13240 [Mycetocola manganoxydans]|nr:hypothetical protein GCM10008097_13240 [Mycetocola manganoxydans]
MHAKVSDREPRGRQERFASEFERIGFLGDEAATVPAATGDDESAGSQSEKRLANGDWRNTHRARKVRLRWQPIAGPQMPSGDCLGYPPFHEFGPTGVTDRQKHRTLESMWSPIRRLGLAAHDPHPLTRHL